MTNIGNLFHIVKYNPVFSKNSFEVFTFIPDFIWQMMANVLSLQYLNDKESSS